MSYKYHILLADEIAGAEIDLDAAITPTEEELNRLQQMKPEEIQGHTLHRLLNEWQSYPAGTLVLYDGQEVLLFLHESN